MVRNGDAVNGAAKIPAFGRITDNGAWTAWFGHLTPAGSNILTGTLIRHGDPDAHGDVTVGEINRSRPGHNAARPA